MHDLRFACRMLLKRLGFTAIAAASLALGIGATTTVFCWMKNVVFRPSPLVAQAERMVLLCSGQGGNIFDTVSYPDLKDYANLTNVFAGVVGSQISPACVKLEGGSEWAYGQIVTANYFDVLGVRPVQGRGFRPDEDEQPGGHPVLVISHAYWQRRFGGDPGVLGRTLELNRHPFTVVGVAPAGFRGNLSGLTFDFWAPLTMHAQVAHFGSLTERGDRWLHTQARLQPGVTVRQAQAAAGTLARRLESAYPGSNRGMVLYVFRVWQAPYGGSSRLLPVLSILLAVSVGVLLIVAANVANLLLARASTRQKEIAIRLAVGAGRGRLVRQLLTESLVLALLGGALGVVVLYWARGLVLNLVPNTYLPIGYSFDLDGPILAFTVGLSVATGVVFGLAPAWQTTRPVLAQVLKEGGRTSGAGLSHHRLRSLLVVGEVALALLLLAGAGLCIKGFQRAQAIDPGFQPQGVLAAALRLGAHGYTEQSGMVFYRTLRQRLASLPGVESAACVSFLPLGFEGGPSRGVSVEGYQPRPNEHMGVPYSIVSPGYFQTLRIPILEGRDFADRDDANAERVVVINQTMAQRFWPGQSPIGRKVQAGLGTPATVIGVVKSGKYRYLSEPPQCFMYLSDQQGAWDLNLGVVVRTSLKPEAMSATLRQEVRALDPGVELWATLPLPDYVQAAYLVPRIAARLLLLLGAIALVLAAMGIYGVMAYVVSQRTHEVGVRLALGAPANHVLGIIVGHGMALAAGGMALGLAGGLVLSRSLASLLYGVSPFDPLTFAAVALVLGLVSLVACYFPARRAAGVDPLVALRYE